MDTVDTGLTDLYGVGPVGAATILGEVADIMYRHGELLAAFHGEDKGMREIRKHVAWYFHGYPVGGQLRAQMAQVATLEQFRELLDQLDLSLPYPGAAVEGPRGRAGAGGPAC